MLCINKPLVNTQNPEITLKLLFILAYKTKGKKITRTNKKL